MGTAVTASNLAALLDFPATLQSPTTGSKVEKARSELEKAPTLAITEKGKAAMNLEIQGIAGL